MFKILLKRLLRHPLGALYGMLLGFVALSSAVPMFRSGMWDAALVDLVMAAILLALMLKTFIGTFRKRSTFANKCFAWLMLFTANILALLPTHEFPGSLSTALAFSLLICGFVLYFSGTLIAAVCILPTLWCCVFMPYHEEFMLLLSYPLRLSATMLSSLVLKLRGVEAICSGTSLRLLDLDIAITDACSGINQLDAFILIAFIAVEMLHKEIFWKILHFAFVIPALIIGNSLRIVITVLFYKICGDVILENFWHVTLGYVQIILALLLFFAVGKLFRAVLAGEKEEKSC